VDIKYEDAWLVVVVKPSGLVMHPAHAHKDGTFWDLLRDLFRARGLSDDPRLLHRLDRDTSGLVCVPKEATAHQRLERALRGGRFEKGYLALVHGRMPSDGLIDAPLGRDSADRRRVCVRADGQQARTRCTAVRRWPDFTLLRVLPETGRTHQIRVHLAHAGHPIVGDAVYGSASAACGRLFLHADRLAFPHPMTRETIRCHAPLPADLRMVLAGLAGA